MADSQSKKEKNKKKDLKRKEKLNKREERKTNNNKGKSLEEMIVYVDVNGNFTDVPPHLQNREEDLKKGGRNRDMDTTFEGVIATFNTEKGFGFIKEEGEKENIFFHNSQLKEPIKVNDKVTFEKEMSDKGFRAVNIKKK